MSLWNFGLKRALAQAHPVGATELLVLGRFARVVGYHPSKRIDRSGRDHVRFPAMKRFLISLAIVAVASVAVAQTQTLEEYQREVGKAYLKLVRATELLDEVEAVVEDVKEELAALQRFDLLELRVSGRGALLFEARIGDQFLPVARYPTYGDVLKYVKNYQDTLREKEMARQELDDLIRRGRR